MRDRSGVEENIYRPDRSREKTATKPGENYVETQGHMSLDWSNGAQRWERTGALCLANLILVFMYLCSPISHSLPSK